MQSKQSNKYPNLRIRNKNGLAKAISKGKFSKDKAIILINDVLSNHEKYWHDALSVSEPEKEKYVRSCKGTKLGRLLCLIDRRILTPHDHLIPNFIFGGLSERDHVQAVHHLLGNQRRRTLLRLDINRFFEQNKQQDIYDFFRFKCKCSHSVSKILANLCSVPKGPKSTSAKGRNEIILARGFATSTRLALWCNLFPFQRVYWKAKKTLEGNDPRIAIFVDDIGITGSKVSKEMMCNLSDEIEKILTSYNLPLNQEKKEKNVISYLDKNMEHLGLGIGRNKIFLGEETRANYNKIKKRLKKNHLSTIKKKSLIKKKKSYDNYRKYVKKISIS